LSLPNALTLARIALAPIIALALVSGQAGLALALFLIAAALDFADGWLARRLDAVSEMGRILDPAADKILVAIGLLALAAAGALPGPHLIPAMAIIGRDALIPAIRERAARAGAPIPVSRLAKWKTAAEMAAIALLILSLTGGAAEPARLVLWAAAALSLWTGWGYLRRAA